MSEVSKPRTGSIAWTDLTVPDAESIRGLDAAVVGWARAPIDMDGYADFTMAPPGGGNPVAGTCHARGGNVGLPAQWLVYVVLQRLDNTVAKCVELGGRAVVGPKAMGDYDRYCAIEDPAGAVAAVFEPV